MKYNKTTKLVGDNIHFRTSHAIKMMLREEAESRDITVSKLVTEILTDYLKQRK